MIDNYEDVTISINYDEIERAKKYASNASTESSGLSKSLDIKTVTPLNHLPGKDSDYVSGAIESLGAKIQELNSKSEKYKTLSNDLGGLLESIKEHENEVIRKIDVLSTGVFPRNEHVYESESIGSLLYLFFSEERCESIMANIDEFFNPVTGFFDDTNDAFNQAKDFLKHGEGRYAVDVVMDVVVGVGAVAAFISAAGLVVSTGGLPFILAAGTSFIGMGYTVNDSITSIVNKAKGYGIYKDTGNMSLACFYGDIDGYSDRVSKTDYGDTDDNKAMEKNAKTHDNIHAAADIISIVLGGVGQLGLKKTKTFVKDVEKVDIVYDNKLIKQRIKPFFKQKFGIIKNSKGKNAFNMKTFIKGEKAKGLVKDIGSYVKEANIDLFGEKGYKAISGVGKFANAIKTGGYATKILNSNDGEMANNLFKFATSLDTNPSKILKRGSQLCDLYTGITGK